MSPLSRKQREIRDREALILDVARAMVVERGYLGLTMDRIAAATEYSKGTIYLHFKNKEDLLAALQLQACSRRLDFFERAARFAGATRERITAIGVADEMLTRTDPLLSFVERILKSASIRDKASDERRCAMLGQERGVMEVLFGIFREAIEHGDLEIRGDARIEDLTLGLWGLCMGTRDISEMEMPFSDLGFSDPLEGLRLNQQLFLDGMGWRPFTQEFDWREVRERVLVEVFAEEVRSLKSR